MLQARRRPLHPKSPEGAGQAHPGLLIRPLELHQARREELRISKRDEAPLEARAAQEPHRRRIQPLRIVARDQHQQRRCLIQPHVRQIPSRRSGRRQVAAGERTTEAGKRRALGCHEHMFA